MNEMSNETMDGPMQLEGAIAVEAALVSPYRKVTAVFADDAMDYRKVEPVRRAAKAQRLDLQRVGRATLDGMVGHDKHGGVLAQVEARDFLTLEGLLEATGSERSFLAMLDGVEDPFNFGQAVRSLWAAGCHGLVLRPRNWTAPGSAATVARASAGATELMPMALAETPEDACNFFSERKLGIVVTDAYHEDAVSLDEADFTGPVFLVLGGEKRGIKKQVIAQATTVVHIPYGRDYPLALGTVAATSVVAFEVRRQRAAALRKRK